MRPVACTDRAHLRDADLEVRKQFEQEGFESFVSAIDFVDQQNRGGILRENRSQQWALQQEFATEDVFLFLFDASAPFLPGA